ncbi:MAG: prepilin-type N-terminal cleavage/methylation domain-containing protein [Planctomycetes bacterium]|nr:prepilin-type N-terminal cleavage/methylation domain-containing protein [Planctomycetota bacterium]
MADPIALPTPASRRVEAGFTLAEMLVALAILLLGMTALLGSLGRSIGQRRTTEARLQTAQLVEQAVLRVRQEVVRSPGAETDLDLQLQPLADQTTPGFPGMKWSATAQLDDARPDVWLITIDVDWMEEGELVRERFLRILPRQLPLSARVQRFRDASGFR